MRYDTVVISFVYRVVKVRARCGKEEKKEIDGQRQLENKRKQ